MLDRVLGCLKFPAMAQAGAHQADAAGAREAVNGERRGPLSSGGRLQALRNQGPCRLARGSPCRAVPARFTMALGNVAMVRRRRCGDVVHPAWGAGELLRYCTVTPTASPMGPTGPRAGRTLLSAAGARCRYATQACFQHRLTVAWPEQA